MNAAPYGSASAALTATPRGQFDRRKGIISTGLDKRPHIREHAKARVAKVPSSVGRPEASARGSLRSS